MLEILQEIINEFDVDNSIQKYVSDADEILSKFKTNKQSVETQNEIQKYVSDADEILRNFLNTTQLIRTINNNLIKKTSEFTFTPIQEYDFNTVTRPVVPALGVGPAPGVVTAPGGIVPVAASGVNVIGGTGGANIGEEAVDKNQQDMLLQILQEIINDFDQIDSVARMVQDADSLISRILNPIKEVEDITKMLKDAEYILTRILNPVRSSSSLYEIKKIEETATDNFNRKTENELQKLLSNNPSYDLLIQRTNPPPISYLYDEIEENTPPNNNLYDYDKLTMIQDNVNDPYYPKIENFKALASA